MGLTITSYPVSVEAGKILNIFAGFNDVNILFKREDETAFNVSSGLDNNILIQISGDKTSLVNPGENIYMYSATIGYIYDNSYRVLTVEYNGTLTEFTVDSPFIVSANSGYINYKQNYFVETKLVNVDNNNIKVFPYLIEDDGTPSGEITINVSNPVDFLSSSIEATSNEITDARIRFSVMYREVWRGNQTQSFTLIESDPIIITYAAETQAPELFINNFETPKIWSGYPFFLNALHSLDNEPANNNIIDFFLLDINRVNLVLATELHNFSLFKFGFLQSVFNTDDFSLDVSTRFIRFNLNSVFTPEYSSEYTAGDYNT